jgi:hypothetical protein
MAASTKPVIVPTLVGMLSVAIAIMVDSTKADANPFRKRIKQSITAALEPDKTKGTAAKAPSIRDAIAMENNTWEKKAKTRV